MRYLVFCLPLLLTALAQPPMRAYHLTGVAQGTTYHITYYATDSLVTKQQVDSILLNIDSSLSIYKPFSLISRFNRADSGITMDAHFAAVIRHSLQTFRDTKGLFDVTILPLVQAWGFGAKKIDSMPGKATIQRLKQCVSSNNLVVSGNRLTKRMPCVMLDVNGIAQGYSVDIMAGFLEAAGITNYLVELGGEIKVKGRKANGERMKIGIEAPADNAFAPSLMQHVVQLDSGAITTSGSYRKYYESNGKKVTHIIDSKTGYPIQNELISVTVYAHDAVTADAFDNALMVMGLKRALQFTESRPDLAAHFIYRTKNGAIADTASSRFYKLLNH
jgi:thiamine biosynthesis lipoprotein